MTDQFKLFIQVSEKALWHRKGMRPKENLAMAFCREGPHRALYSEQWQSSCQGCPPQRRASMLQLPHPCPWYEVLQTARALTCSRPAPPRRLPCEESQEERGHLISTVRTWRGELEEPGQAAQGLAEAGGSSERFDADPRMSAASSVPITGEIIQHAHPLPLSRCSLGTF